MSIIYEALKKTQEQREPIREMAAPVKKISAKRTKTRIFFYGMMIALIFLANYPAFKKNHHPVKTIAKLTPPTAPVTPPAVTSPPVIQQPIVLNGIFISNQKQTALIDNQFYTLGDTIQGMKIISIETKSVKLQNANGSILELHSRV